jgi:hypothetical protein
MTSLHEPAVSMLLLFSVEDARSEEAEPLCRPWEGHDWLALELEADEPDCQRYVGQMRDGTPCRLTWGLAHDTHLLRLTLSLPGAQTPAAWAKLQRLLDTVVERAWEDGPEGPYPCHPWAATRLYHALVSASTETDEVQTVVSDPAGLGLDSDDAERADPTPCGWMWSMRAGWESMTAGEGARYWVRSLALLTPQDRANRVRTFYLDPLTQGFARIELYLHKGLHHARQHEATRAELEGAGIELQNAMLVALRTTDFSQLHREQQELEEIARRLMDFLAQKTQAEVLLNSLRCNLQAFTEHLERVKLESSLYAGQAARLARHIEQLESDLCNARAVSESTYVFQDIQRGVEAARLERASFLLGGAAAVLAGVAIYNSFLEIWKLVVEGSGLELPWPWLRVVLGTLAAVSWPLGAYWAVQRRKARAAVALFVGLLTVAAAVISTLLVSP